VLIPYRKFTSYLKCGIWSFTCVNNHFICKIYRFYLRNLSFTHFSTCKIDGSYVKINFTCELFFVI
jgi:hypothetical protein